MRLLTNILLIIEGAGDELNYFSRLSKITSGNITKFNFFVYKTNIYQLYQELASYDFDVEIEDVLRNNKQNSIQEKECLQNKFAYKYLIFDFEFQDKNSLNKKEALSKMINYFSDETENGKLYINYPMMESYRDMKVLGETDYENTFIDVCDLFNYKQIVGNRGNCIDIKKYLWEDFIMLSSMNVKKGNSLLNHNYCLKSYDDYLENLSQLNIMNKQFNFINDNSIIYVINCSSFLLIDYFGAPLFKKL